MRKLFAGRSVSCLLACGALFLGLSACSSDDTPPGAVAGASSGGAGGSVAGSAGASIAGGGATSAGSGGVAGSAAGSPSGGSGGALAGSGGASGAAGTSGAAGSGGSGGSGGSAPYSPCPATGECKVMPLGDSITDGCCGGGLHGSYRTELFHLALSGNKALTFVGSGQGGPDKVDNVTFPKKHEGHPGWVIADGGGRDGLQDMIVGWLNTSSPDIVTLMIGTNDTDIQLDLVNAPMRLGKLLDTIIQTKPNTLIVLAQIVPSKKDPLNARVKTYNDAMPALVKSRADAGKHVILVDLNSAFTKNANYKTDYFYDDLHPNDTGHAVMAKVWFDAIGGLLRSPK